jgi:hypothetical protein
MGYIYTALSTLSEHLRETRVFEMCNPAIAMVPLIAEKLVLSNDKIYTQRQQRRGVGFPTLDFMSQFVQSAAK